MELLITPSLSLPGHSHTVYQRLKVCFYLPEAAVSFYLRFSPKSQLRKTLACGGAVSIVPQYPH